MQRTTIRTRWHWIALFALIFGAQVSAQTPDADIEAVQRKLDAAKRAQAEKDAAARRSQEQLARMATLLFRTDADCSLSINGKAQGVLAVGDTKEVKVNPGDQIVDCTSTEVASIAISELKTATAGAQSVVLLQLADRVNQERQQAAAAAQARADAEARAIADAQAARERMAAEQAAAEARAKFVAELAARFVAQTDGSVRDTQTDLVWAGQDNGSDINWKGATRYCAKKGGGWSLPTVAQLQALYDSSGTLTQSCGGKFACEVTPLIRLSSYFFWSSEPDGSSEAWLVELVTGHRVSFTVGYANDRRALCVRRS